MHIGIPYSKRKNTERVMGVCSFCAQDVFYGERVWRGNGTLACEDCFEQFARLELRPFEEILGEEEKNDTL